MTPDTAVDLRAAEERWAAGLPVTDTETSALFAEVKRLRADRDALIARLRDAAHVATEATPERLREAALGSPHLLRTWADDHERCNRPYSAAVLRVVADVIE